MPIRVTCAHCNATFGVKEKHAGMRGRCPKCNGEIQVPAARPAPELDTSWLDDLENDEPPSTTTPTGETPARQPTPERISFHCGHCGAAFEVAGSLAGRAAKCQKCGQQMRVSHKSETKPAAPAPTPGPAPARATTHFANPLATPARPRTQPAAAAAPPDDLLSELGFGVASVEQTAPAAGSPFRSYQSLGQTLAKPKRKRAASGFGWEDYTFLGLCLVGLLWVAFTGVWTFLPIFAAAGSCLIVSISCFRAGEVGMGLASLVCGLPAYIIGWIRSRDYGLTRIMIGWTLALVLMPVFFMLDAVLVAMQAAQNARAKHLASELANGPIETLPGAKQVVAGGNASMPASSASKIPPGWQVHTLLEAECRVAMPEGRPVRRSEMIPGPQLLRMTGEGVESDGRRTAYLMAFTSPPMFYDESKFDEQLKSGRDSLAKLPGFKIVGERHTTIAGSKCLEIDVAVQQGIMTYWTFIARGRLYQLMVARPETEKGQHLEKEFVDSFEFLTPESPQHRPRDEMPEGASLARQAPQGNANPLADDPSPARTRNSDRPRRSSSVSDFEEALADLESDTPVFGLQALARMRPNDQRAKVVAAVLPFVEGNDEFLRSDAIEVLGVWGTEENLPTLIELLRDQEVFVRHAAIEAVARYKTAAGAEAIADRLPHDKHQADEALRSMGEVAAPAVVRYLQHPDQFTRMTACEILEEIGTVDSARELYKLERDRSPLVVNAADQAIRAIRVRHQGDVPAASDNGGRPSALRPATPK